MTEREEIVTHAVLSERQRGQWLGPSQYQLLRYLAAHAGRFVPVGELLDKVFDGAADDSTVRQAVRRVRALVGERVIESMQGLGYRVPLGVASELEMRCERCFRPMVDYRDVAQCFGCGFQVRHPAPLEQAVDLDVGRAPYREGSRSGQAWTKEEVGYVLDNLRFGYEELGAALDRTGNAVRGLLDDLGIAKPYPRRKDLGGGPPAFLTDGADGAHWRGLGAQVWDRRRGEGGARGAGAGTGGGR